MAIRLNNELVFPDPKSPIINITDDQKFVTRLNCFFMFSFANIIKVSHFCIVLLYYYI